MHSRITALVLILILLSSSVAMAFTDTKGHWAEEYANELNQKGIFAGDDNNRANLSDYIKRSEFIALLMRALYQGQQMPKGRNVYKDVSSNSWYYDVVSFASEIGIVKGDDSGYFMPNNLVKREEVVLMLVRALNLSGGSSDFNDVTKKYVYYNEISAAVKSGIINGYDDGNFAPKMSATRGEAAAMISRMLENYKNPSMPPIPTPSPTPSQSQGDKINLTWQQIYTTGVKVTGNHMEGLDVISPMWFRVVDNTNETPKSNEYKLDGDINFYLEDLGNADYMKDAKMEGYKVWALYKNDFSAKTTSKFLNSDAARWSAINQIKNLIVKYDLDGINMDFENMYVSDKDVYSWYVKEMADMCKSVGATLSVDVTKRDVNGGTWSMCYDRKAIAKYADYVALMAYDENGTWSTKAGSVGSMPWVENSIKITLEDVPAEKLLLGIPFYTRLWEEKDGKVVKTTAIGMATAQNKIAEAGAKIVYDSKTGQNYAEWQSGDSVFKIWLEDETSIKARIDLSSKYNLAGIASWSKTFETPSTWAFIDKNLK